VILSCIVDTPNIPKDEVEKLDCIFRGRKYGFFNHADIDAFEDISVQLREVTTWLRQEMST